MAPGRLITLTTDFGPSSCFVGIMKGVISSIAPGVQVVDLTHAITPGSIREAAFILSKSYAFFPENSVHVVVVDPGVGTKRRILCLVKGKTLFLAPDNGVLSFVMGKGDRLYRVSEDAFFLKPVSRTFHGRDVFAPVAAFLSRGLSPISLGPKVSDPVKIAPSKVKVEGGRVVGELLFPDTFGNLITSIEEGHLEGKRVRKITVGGRKVEGPLESFEEGRGKGLCAIFDSFGHLEIFCYLESAKELIGNWRELEVEVLLE